jgi:glycosyltransferase involved in cell wall biosynthesis
LKIEDCRLKIAIYYDWLNQWGGAERVLLDLLELYPDADIYTLDYQPEKCPWLPKNHQIYSLNLKNKLLYSPFYAFKLEQLDFSGYDILISTTSNIGHCFLTLPKTLFICYFHNINRYLYQNPPNILKPLLNKYQSIDKIYGQRPDYLFCNSQNVANKIQKHYQLQGEVIYPGIDLEKFKPSGNTPEPYFLIVSRLVPHKKIDLVINAFSGSQYQLKIVGRGREEKYLKCLAEGSNNIQFIDAVSEDELIKLYQNCTALIYPQEEDFGLSAIEAQACGRGVIAFNQGGARETVINHKTGILFGEQNKESLLMAIKQYLKLAPSPHKTRLQAQKFDRQSFMLNFKKQVDNLWSKRQ